MPKRAWRSILQGPEAAKAREIADRIGDRLLAHLTGEPSGPSLGGGRAGIALCLRYLERDLDKAKFQGAWLSRIAQAFQEFRFPNHGPSLFSGFAGIAWSWIHAKSLTQREGSPANEPQLQSEVNRFLEAYVQNMSSSWPFDLLNGSIGVGVLAAECPSDQVSRNAASSVVQHLDKTAKSENGQITWFTAPGALPLSERENFPKGYYNLGVAHGVPGVLLFLSRASDLGIEPAACKRLLQGGAAWLETQRCESAPGIFPCMVGEGVTERAFGQGWCYGDPGVLFCIYVIRKKLRDEGGAAEAIRQTNEAARRILAAPEKLDFSLCHGLAGLAHIWNRMAHDSGDEGLAEAASNAFRLLLQRWEVEGAKLDDLGLANGASGVALALLSAASDEPPEWDRCMLLSMPAGTLNSRTA